jgi:DNA helicase-2/ATP-dependent DNA helicase PcrA
MFKTLLENENDDTRTEKIVMHKQGSGLVAAGPGAGKTHVLCCRAQHLIKRGVPLERILLLTFSKAAALNMSTRLRKKFNVDDVRCSTTHALGLDFIMEYWRDLGFTDQPTVQIKLLAKQLAFIVKKVAAKDKVDAEKLRGAVYGATKAGKNKSQIGQEKGLSKAVADVLRRYQKFKLRKNRVDYADMLDLSTQLLKTRPDIQKKVGTSIDHLLVDEVQDMKMQECQLLYYLAKQTKTAVLVGDKKQNIYAFRGADPRCLHKLEKHLKPVVYHLTESFRVPSQMLPLVNAIGAAINDDPKLTSDRKGFKPSFFRSTNNDEQSDFVVREIKKLLDKGVPVDEIAVLGRTRRPMILLKTALNTSGIETFEAYCSSKGEPVKVLKALILIAKWKARCPKRGKYPFKPVKALLRVLENSGLSERIQQEL